MSRTFSVSFTIVDDDPTGDERDRKAIIEIITREFSYDSYILGPIIMEEKELNNATENNTKH